MILNPSNQVVNISSVSEVGFNRFRISFPAQTPVGEYQIVIGPNILDLAGNPLDQDQDGAFGEPAEDFYDASFQIVDFDLEISDITVSTNEFYAGDPITISWTGFNASGAPLIGEWSDGVYLSKDDQWDFNDTRLAVVPHTGGLAEDATYSEMATVALPGILPGDYFLLIRTDIFNQEKEEPEENVSDNVIAFGPVQIQVRSFDPLSGPYSGTLTPLSSAHYFRIQVPPSQSIRISLTGMGATGAALLFTGLESIPTRQVFDLSSTESSQSQDLIFTSIAYDSDYYIMVYGDQITEDNPYEISLTMGNLLISDVSPKQNTGFGTLSAPPMVMTIAGAGFELSTTVELIDSSGGILFPTEINFISSETLTAKIDLTRISHHRSNEAGLVAVKGL